MLKNFWKNMNRRKLQVGDILFYPERKCHYQVQKVCHSINPIDISGYKLKNLTKGYSNIYWGIFSGPPDKVIKLKKTELMKVLYE